MGNLNTKVKEVVDTNVKPTLAAEIIEKQKKIIELLQNTNDQINLNIDYAPTTAESSTTLPSSRTIEGFDVAGYNIERERQFSLPLSQNPELKDISQIYNDTIPLLNDSSIMDDIAFKTYIDIQNKRISELQKNINEFPRNNNIQNNPIKAIKNIGTSNTLNVEEYNNPNTPENNKNSKKNYTGNGGTRYPNYLIYGNNGCLEYTSPEKYNFKPCNANDPKQRFNMSQISNIQQYNAKITDSNNDSYKINNADNTILGFYVVNPETNNNNCLTINNDGLSVIPCNMNNEQRFKPYYHSIYQ